MPGGCCDTAGAQAGLRNVRVGQHQGGSFRSPFRPPVVLSDCIVEKPEEESFRRLEEWRLRSLLMTLGHGP